MTTDVANVFIDNMQYSDYPVMFQGKCYWCLGVTWYDKVGAFVMQVIECKDVMSGGIRTVFEYRSTSRDECMKHFIEDKYWNGKSFWEVAHELEWV